VYKKNNLNRDNAYQYAVAHSHRLSIISYDMILIRCPKEE